MTLLRTHPLTGNAPARYYIDGKRVTRDRYELVYYAALRAGRLNCIHGRTNRKTNRIYSYASA